MNAKSDEIKEARQALHKSKDRLEGLKQEASKIARKAKKDVQLELVLKSVSNYTLDQLEADIDSEKARLELTQGGNIHVIREFEEREKQIEMLQNKLTAFHENLGKFQEAIAEVRGTWEPRLDALVQKISDAFSDSFARIGCAGQVTLDKAEDEDGPDFEQWSIQIHVKFRQNEHLSQLNAHRQSGGERAVSTIFYLMALQSLSASPFRVVDEINQGMDPRNERMVHERMVDIACASSENGGDGGGQYFLITPKLLNGLAYKPGMRVLCIVSGEHMPEDYKLVDFRRAIKKMKEISGRPIANNGNGSGSRKGKERAVDTGTGTETGSIRV